MAVQAIAKGVRMSPRKVAVVAGLVRGRSVEDALTILDHTPRRAALEVAKVVKSAKANADYNHRLKPGTLQIIEISVTPASRITRIRPGARGGYNRYQLKSSHIKVVVDGEKRAPRKPASTQTSKEVKVEKAKADTKRTIKKEDK